VETVLLAVVVEPDLLEELFLPTKLEMVETAQILFLAP
jgi:hypothetical protein